MSAADQPPATAPGTCPLCGQRLYGWVALPPANEASIGAPVSAAGTERVIDRCEGCGVALERDRAIDLEAEWEAVCRPDPEPGRRRIEIPNRDSVQAWIGGVGWAAIDLYPGRLIHNADSLGRLAAANGQVVERHGSPLSRRAQGWMWQTLLNGLTFHPNFIRELRAGRLRAATARSRSRFAVDLVVSVLAAPLVLLVSAPLELGAALARRGGELKATARPR